MDRGPVQYLVAGIFFFIASAPLMVRSQTASSTPKPSSTDTPVRFAYQPIDFMLDSDETPEHHAPETMAGGDGVLDYNNDRKLDVFFLNDAAIKTLTQESPKYSNLQSADRGKGLL